MGILNIKKNSVYQTADNHLFSATLITLRMFFICSTVAVFLIQCGMPNQSANHPIRLSISSASTTQLVPQDLTIEIRNDNDFFEAQSVSNPSKNGSVSFTVQKGFIYYIDISGYNNGIRTLYGYTECEVSDDGSAAFVQLRNIIAIDVLSGGQEDQFLQALPRSPFWAEIPQESTARCIASDNSEILRTTIATSRTHLYILCVVNDPDFFTDDRPLTTIGEMTADAVIVYTCKITPDDLATAQTPYPAVRVQCETGRAIPENGKITIENLTSSNNISRTIRDCNDDIITARLIRQDNIRLLEMRIQRSLLNLPTNFDDEPPASIVIRYRDGNSGNLSDWQTGTVTSNPNHEMASWGYLEMIQK